MGVRRDFRDSQNGSTRPRFLITYSCRRETSPVALIVGDSVCTVVQLKFEKIVFLHVDFSQETCCGTRVVDGMRSRAQPAQ